MTRARAASRSRGALSVTGPRPVRFGAVRRVGSRAGALVPRLGRRAPTRSRSRWASRAMARPWLAFAPARPPRPLARLQVDQRAGIPDPRSHVGQFSSRAADTNFDGSLIVGTSTQPPTVSLTASWTAPGPASGLVPLPLSAYVAGMSDSGVTIGDYLQGPAVIGYRFTGTEFAALLGFGGASANTNAVGISPEGSVVVGRAATDSGFRAARWNAGNSAAIALPQLTAPPTRTRSTPPRTALSPSARRGSRPAARRSRRCLPRSRPAIWARCHPWIPAPTGRPRPSAPTAR